MADDDDKPKRQVRRKARPPWPRIIRRGTPLYDALEREIAADAAELNNMLRAASLWGDPDYEFIDWIKNYGPYGSREDRSRSHDEWEADRRKAARRAFPNRKITQARMRRLGRRIGRGFS